MRVMIVTTHLRGAGHLARSFALAEGVRAAGGAACVVNGGAPGFDAKATQIPPLRSDGINYKRLLTLDGDPVDAAYMRGRAAALRQALDAFAPDALITELFPFGRRVLADEFEALLAFARPRVRQVFASVRDILEPPSKPARMVETERRLLQWYDGVLVHADPAVVRLEDHWPITPVMAPLLRYTGYVAPPAQAAAGDGAGEILVSAGTGPTGDALFRAAVAAAHLNKGRRWRLLVGGHDARIRIAALTRQAAGAPVIVESLRSDFRALLAQAAVFIGQCGYNTALDVLTAGAPAVWTPFVGSGEIEQTARAQALAARFGHQIVALESAAPAALSAAIAASIAQPRGSAAGLRLDGAAEAARLIRAALR